jgi:hypothetical protein
MEELRLFSCAFFEVLEFQKNPLQKMIDWTKEYGRELAIKLEKKK